MKIIMDLFFLLVVGYYAYKFIRLLVNMKQRVILPTTDEELTAIRKHPQSTLALPTYSNHKVGIILYLFMLLFLIVMYFIGVFTMTLNWSFYMLLFLPLVNSQNLFNLFVIAEDGILDGFRFIRWNKIKSYQFAPIDINHKYYGYSREVNDAYELKIKTRGFPISCIVTSDEMREKLSKILNERINV